MSKNALASMTGFVRLSDGGDWGHAIWEIRTVNHRYLDTSWRLPGELRELEISLRDVLRQSLQRGKVDCQLRFTAGAKVETSFSVNQTVVNALVQAQQEVAQIINNHTPMQAIDALQWPGAVVTDTPDLSVANQAITALFAKAVEQLVQRRQEEGIALQALLSQRIKELRVLLETVIQQRPVVLAAQRKNMEERLQEITERLNTDRLEQEMLILAQKLDITEECDRLTTHFDALDKLLAKGGAVGRRLDFFMQELNRETNTIGSKSNDAILTQAVVDMKVLIEQMREQIQNIE